MKLRRCLLTVLCAVPLAACGHGSRIESSAEAARVVKRQLAGGHDCGGAGVVRCTPRRGGWECRFGVTQDGYAGAAFVSQDGQHVNVLSIC